MTWSTAPCTIRSLIVGTPNPRFSWLPGLGIHTRLTAFGWYCPALSSCSSFWIVCSWCASTARALWLSIPALPPLATTFCSDPARFLGFQTLSISRNHLPPSVPVSRVANMRSVQTVGSTHAHRARVSPPCWAVPGTVEGCCSFVLSFTLPPSCLPCLHGHYPASSLLRRLCHLPGTVLRAFY